MKLPTPRLPAHHARRPGAEDLIGQGIYRQKGYGADDETLIDDDDDRLTTAMTVCSGPLRFQSEPPSPPPTPKVSDIPFDTHGPTLRPKNSVFAIFCPEAMTLQVNLQKAPPTKGSCECGFRWQPRSTQDKEPLLLKEGFKLTDRYLAKSHVGRNAYGCVLCTSRGKSEKFKGARLLKDHINACHSKWQLLHDVDCRVT
jgi:hypothetical protein